MKEKISKTLLSIFVSLIPLWIFLILLGLFTLGDIDIALIIKVVGVIVLGAIQVQLLLILGFLLYRIWKK